MVLLFVFGLTLLLGVLISELADRSIVSTAVLFLLAGIAAGPGALGYVSLGPGSPTIEHLAELALIAVLFTDGMKLGWTELRSAWALPGRALLFGLPLTMVITALFARYVAGLHWLDAWLVGAVLSPTDPVFASAIAGREEVSRRLRHLLNVESGLNDGLALPIVLGLLAVEGATSSHMPVPLLELLAGGVIGILVPAVALAFERTRFFHVARSHEPFLPFAIGLLAYSVAALLSANEFIASFTAGITVATVRPTERHEFSRFGEQVSELLKLAAVLVFGLSISPSFLAEIPLRGYAFAALALLVARPLGLGLALIGSDMPRRERLAALWFGPKGFASVIYGLMVLRSGIVGANMAFHLVALVVVASIVSHSSTDVLIARWLRCGERHEAASDSEAVSPGR